MESILKRGLDASDVTTEEHNSEMKLMQGKAPAEPAEASKLFAQFEQDHNGPLRSRFIPRPHWLGGARRSGANPSLLMSIISSSFCTLGCTYNLFVRHI
jgi:hypothetical protein